MPTKTIAVPGPTYERLKHLRRPKETFADTIDRLMDEQELGSKKDISSIFGILGDDSDEWDEIEKKIYAERLRDTGKPRECLDV
jgi:predicted CopG family antitoxin